MSKENTSKESVNPALRKTSVSGSYDTPNCDKCGNHTALVTGTFFYSADDEPFENGVQQEILINDECWVGGYLCLSCKNMQGLWHE